MTQNMPVLSKARQSLQKVSRFESGELGRGEPDGASDSRQRRMLLHITLTPVLAASRVSASQLSKPLSGASGLLRISRQG
jgi:hypothetical protein